MLALKIILVVIGLAFTLFGYFIFFKKKYSLINGFNDAFKSGQKTEEYAKRVGIVEFMIGIIILIVSVVLVILTWQIATMPHISIIIGIIEIAQ